MTLAGETPFSKVSGTNLPCWRVFRNAARKGISRRPLAPPFPTIYGILKRYRQRVSSP